MDLQKTDDDLRHGDSNASGCIVLSEVLSRPYLASKGGKIVETKRCPGTTMAATARCRQDLEGRMPVHAGRSLSEAMSSDEWRPFVTGFVVESEDVHRGAIADSSKECRVNGGRSWG